MAVERFTAQSGTPPYTQDFTTEKLGGLTPTGMMLFASEAVSDGVPANKANRCWGVASAADEEYSLCTFNQHNAGTQTVCSWSRNYVLLLGLNPLAKTADCRAEVDSFITNGVRLNWLDSPGSAWMITILFFAGSIQAHAGYVDLDNGIHTRDATGLGFEADMVFHGAIDQISGSDDTYVNALSCGVSHNDGAGGITEYAVVNQAASGQTEGYLVKLHKEAAIVMNFWNTGLLDWFATTQDYDSDGFTYNVQNGGSNWSFAFFLALKFTEESAVFEFSTPTSPGQDAYSGLGFTPSCAGMILSGAEAQDVAYVDNRAGTVGMAWWDGTDELCNTISGEDEADPTNTQSLSDDRAIAVPDDDGVLLQEAAFVSMDEDGFTLDWSNVHGTAKKWAAWAVGGGIAATVDPGTRLSGVSFV